MDIRILRVNIWLWDTDELINSTGDLNCIQAEKGPINCLKYYSLLLCIKINPWDIKAHIVEETPMWCPGLITPDHVGG